MPLQVLAGRLLATGRKEIPCPLVRVEISGASYDNNRYETRSISTKRYSCRCEDQQVNLIAKVIGFNGFNPVWAERSFEFDIYRKEIALLRFVVVDIDTFFDQKFLAQAVFPVNCIRSGLRSVPLKTGFGETIELASLLVEVQM